MMLVFQLSETPRTIRLTSRVESPKLDLTLPWEMALNAQVRR